MPLPRVYARMQVVLAADRRCHGQRFQFVRALTGLIWRLSMTAPMHASLPCLLRSATSLNQTTSSDVSCSRCPCHTFLGVRRTTLPQKGSSSLGGRKVCNADPYRGMSDARCCARPVTLHYQAFHPLYANRLLSPHSEK
jgi:hypothetical protein